MGLEDSLPAAKLSNPGNLEHGPGQVTKSSFILAVHIGESTIREWNRKKIKHKETSIVHADNTFSMVNSFHHLVKFSSTWSHHLTLVIINIKVGYNVPPLHVVGTGNACHFGCMWHVPKSMWELVFGFARLPLTFPGLLGDFSRCYVVHRCYWNVNIDNYILKWAVKWV